MKKYLILLGLHQALAISVGLMLVFILWVLRTFIQLELSPPSEIIRFFGVVGYVITALVTTIFFVDNTYGGKDRRAKVFKWIAENFSNKPSQD